MLLKKRKFIVILFIFLIFAILTYQAIKRPSDTSRFHFLNYPFKKLEQVISALSKGTENVFRRYILIVGKEEENRRLVEEIKNNEQLKNQYLEVKYENEKLREILKLKSKTKNYITTSEVFSRDPTNWFHILWINKGKDDGISRDMIAVTPLGAVGRIRRVFSKRASIILVTDVNSSVAVRIQSSRVEGMLEGVGDSRCYVKYVPQEVDVKVGERIITSGLDGIYPGGLLIGYVTNIKKKSGDLFQLIEVEAAQNLQAVEKVTILKR